MDIPYPRKYWWVAVLVALVVAAIPVLPHFFSRDDRSDASPGANLTLGHAISPQSDFYVQTSGHDGSEGDYQLTVRME